MANFTQVCNSCTSLEKELRFHYEKARRFLEQSLVQRELGVYLFSMATILLLGSIVHCYSYTRCMHLHTGRKDYPSTSFRHIEAPIHS
jgi:hypothetical protein